MLACPTIKTIQAYTIYDSRGLPTVESELVTNDGRCYKASVPSGASTGKHEAVELRDGDEQNWHGKGVLKAIDSINKIIAPALKDSKITDQQTIDKLLCSLDGTDNKGRLGANAILSVSLCVARAASDHLNVPLCKYINGLMSVPKPMSLPIPYFNVINGGRHAGNLLGFQEFMIVPKNTASFKESMKIGSEVYHSLKFVIEKKYGLAAVNVGDEGGFAPPIASPEDALDLIVSAIDDAGHNDQVAIALDVAASGIIHTMSCC